MRERQSHSSIHEWKRRPESTAEVRQALAVVEGTVGHKPVVERVEMLPDGVRAMMQRPTEIGDRYRILYARAHEPYAPHLVTHAAGQILRLHQVPPEERFVARANERAYARELLRLGELMPTRLPQEIERAMLKDYFMDMAGSIANLPANMRVDQAIWNEFPGLRGNQRASMRDDVQRGYHLLGRPLRVFAPPVVREAILSMNAAQALHTTTITGDTDLIKPYIAEPRIVQRGYDLAHAVFAVKDEGHRSDIAASKDWARTLGVADWVSWEEPQI